MSGVREGIPVALIPWATETAQESPHDSAREEKKNAKGGF